MCNYQSVYLHVGVSFFNILGKLYLKISQMSVDRYVIFVLLVIYEKLEELLQVGNIKVLAFLAPMWPQNTVLKLGHIIWNCNWSTF